MKRVLVITYYWPPAGGPGVQRWLKFVKYFRDFDIEPVVYIPENPHYPLIDSSFVSDISEDIEVLSFPIKEPYRWAKFISKKKTASISSGIITKKNPSFLEKLMLFIRGNCFIPDARIGWVKPSVDFLRDYLSNQNIDTIITTGPPHSVHLIGAHLKEQLKIKWVADFRDPWTSIHYHSKLRLTKYSQQKHKKLEKKVLCEANAVVVTSQTTKREFELIAKTPIEVITNGYDISDDIESNLDKHFSIVHIGSLLGDRNRVVLWKVLSEMASENSDFRSDLQLKFAGAVSKEVLDNLSYYGLNKNIKVEGYVSHREALQLQHNAQVLLLIEMDRKETRAIIPGKLFEYMAAKRPILALGPKESDIIEIIRETNSGLFFSYDDHSELKNHVLKLYAAFKNNELSVTSSGIFAYCRKELTSKMAQLIYKLN